MQKGGGAVTKKFPKTPKSGKVYVRRNSNPRKVSANEGKVRYTIEPRYRVIHEDRTPYQASEDERHQRWQEAANEVLTERASLWKKLAKL